MTYTSDKLCEQLEYAFVYAGLENAEEWKHDELTWRDLEAIASALRPMFAATRNTALEEAAGIADGIDDDALYPSLIGAAIRAAKVAES